MRCTGAIIFTMIYLLTTSFFILQRMSHAYTSGICDWGMETKSAESMKSLYTFTDVQSMTQILAERWWVDPMVAHLHMRDVDVEIISLLLKTFEEYAVAKLATKINRENMSKDYHKL
jgi:hypothetical protein